MAFYVPPHKLHDTLADMQNVLGGSRQCCVAREVTKKFEEYIRGTIDDVISKLDGVIVKGEITLLVEGSDVNVGDHVAPKVCTLSQHLWRDRRRFVLN